MTPSPSGAPREYNRPMDVERTIESILAQQARSAEWQHKTDRQVAGLQKLAVMGMQMLVKNDREHAEFRKELLAIKKEQSELRREMAALVKKTDARFVQADAKFERLMAALLRQRPNGRP